MYIFLLFYFIFIVKSTFLNTKQSDNKKGQSLFVVLIEQEQDEKRKRKRKSKIVPDWLSYIYICYFEAVTYEKVFLVIRFRQ